MTYLRYDTEDEPTIMNSLCQNELRLYKNFFCPAVKLLKKERIEGKAKSTYHIPKTPHQRLIQSGRVSEKEKLQSLYLHLRSCELKRKIEEKTQRLYQPYEDKTTRSCFFQKTDNSYR